MIEYITVADVEAALPAGWEGSGDKETAVLQANTYLNTLRFKAWDTQPDAITQAGAQLAKEAAAGNLYADSDGVMKREKVKADTVEYEGELADGSAPRSGALQFVDALLAPYIIRRGSVELLRRL